MKLIRGRFSRLVQTGYGYGVSCNGGYGGSYNHGSGFGYVFWDENDYYCGYGDGECKGNGYGDWDERVHVFFNNEKGEIKNGK